MGTLKWAACVVVLVACGPAAPPDPLGTANAALDEGSPRRALSEVAQATAGPEFVARLQALIELNEWGQFTKLLREVPEGADKTALLCLQAAKRRDVDGERRCEAANASPAASMTLVDATQRAHAVVLETEQHLVEAEATLRKLASARPTTANHKAVVAYLDRQGFVREAAAYLEGWLAAAPGDKSLAQKLVQILERKVRGDLLEKNASEAEAAARRILALDPRREQIRYFLADALELRGDKAGAEAERAAAKASGATPPVAVDTIPGLPPEAPGHGHAHEGGPADSP